MARVITDMTGATVLAPDVPVRIVSLVPSQTELLYTLGMGDRVVGITKFCVHPNDWFRNKKRVGGTKNVHIDIVKDLQPDLVIANKEENTREQVEELATLFPTWVSDIKTVEQGLEMIRQLGMLTNTATEAGAIIQEINGGFESLTVTLHARRVAYFIWRNPWMSVGGDTFISDMIGRMGWVNVLADRKRYPAIELEELKDLNVNMVLLSSEPYPFKDQHIAEIAAVLPGAEVRLVDGEMFSWYGSRMRLAPAYLRTLLNA